MAAGRVVGEWLLLLCLWLHAQNVAPHGRLMEPPSRASMHRLGYNTPRNYEDNQLFCGGVQVKPALLWRSAGKASSSSTGMAVLPFLLEHC